jgi:Relaxase/Mobilisation nuclease domain
MIAISTTGRTFAGLTRYLLRGRTGVEHDRIAWVETHNLALQDPERAGRLMQATAAQNHRVAHPVYHLVISFDPADRPAPAIMRQVADRLLADLRLSEHETLIVAHKDRAHAHLHIVVNRVHPETGRAWSPWQDYVATQRTLRTLERTLGLHEVEGRLYQLPDEAPPQCRERRVEPQGLSHGPALAPERRPIIAEATARVRDLDLAHQLREMRYRAEQRLFELNAKLTTVRDAHARAMEASRDFDGALAKAYTNPQAARTTFQALLGPHPETMRPEARRTMAEDPHFFGDLRAEKRPILFGLFHRADDTAARSHANDAAQLGVRASVTSEHLQQTLERQGIKIAPDHIDAYTRVVTRLQGRLDTAKRELGCIDLTRHALPDERTLQRAASVALLYVLPEELHHVARALTAPQMNLANSVRSMTTDLVMGRERHIG